MWLPSFLTFPDFLPYLSSISLPANIQRRFLSYVLKRALGRFFVASGFEVERIQAQLSQGWVELERLEVNELNAFIPEGLPLAVTAGEVAKVSARVPFPNLWSDPLSLSIDSLTLDVTVASRGSSGGRRGGSASSPVAPHHIDLASSVTSAADDFVHDELDAFEGAELDRTIRESLILNDDVPGAFPALQETFAGSGSGEGAQVESTTVLASLVERLLTRLQFKVRNVRLRVRYDDTDRHGVLELRLGEVRYADETPETVSGPQRTVRSITLSTVGVYYLPSAPRGTSTTGSPVMNLSRKWSSSSSSTMSSSDDDGADYDDMVMSQAVADLRMSSVAETRPSFSSFADNSAHRQQAPTARFNPQPMAASTASMQSSMGADMFQSAMSTTSGRSVYQSFTDAPEPSEPQPQAHWDEPPSPWRADPPGADSPEAAEPVLEPRVATPPPPDSATSHGTTRTATPTASSEPEETLLLSFGTEDIVLRMTTTLKTPVSREWAHDPHSPVSMPRVVDTPPPPIPSVEVDVSVGTIAAALLPAHTAFILSLAQAAMASSSPPTPASPAATGRNEHNAPQPKFDARVHVKGLYVALVYDLSKASEEYEAALPQFFARPAAVYLPTGHLRLRLENIAGTYSVPAGPKSAPRRPQGGRRKSSVTPVRAPVLDVTVADISLFEYLASADTSDDDEPPGGTFPVLIFDANLPKQYEVPPGAASSLLSSHARTPANLTLFPEFDSVDWRNAGVQKRGGEKVWRVRPKGKGILRPAQSTASPEPSATSAVAIHKELSDSEPASVELLPVRMFLDLSLVERLLPLLRFLAPVVQSSGSGSAAASTPTAGQPTGGPRPLPSLRMADHEPVGPHRRSSVTPPQQLIKLRCPMIRLDIRCPAPLNRRGSWGDGAHLRSGIVTLDIHGLSVNIAQDRPTAPRLQSGSDAFAVHKGGINVEWHKVVLLFSRVPEKRSSAFLVIGPLAPEPGDDEGVLLPSVNVHSELAPITGVKTQSVTCRIPSVQAKIRQSTVEGLQFFADDMTHWLDGAFGDGSTPRPRDDLKMIGSRFFGSKASSSASSSTDYDDDDDFGAATLFRVAISEVEIALLVPKVKGVHEDDAGVSERILSLCASDMDLKLESNATNKQETSVTLSAMDADLFHVAEPGAEPSRLFGRTTPLTLTTHTQPLVNLRFSSITHQDRTKETGVRVTASACTLFVTKDLEWVHDLALYAKTPEGVFEDVVPSEVTRIALTLFDCSVHVSAPTMPGALLVVITAVEARTALESDSDDTTVDIGVSGLNLLAIDDRTAATPLQMGYAVSLDAWKRSGYAPLAELVNLDAQILRTAVPDTTLFDIARTQVRVTACADSLATLGALAGDLSKLGPPKPAPPPDAKLRRPTALDQSIDVFASVDLQAFGQAPDIVAGADMIDDDLPTNLDYLDHAAGAKGPTLDRHTGESLRSWETPDEAPHIQNDLGGGTVKLLMTEPFETDGDYWNTLPVLKDGAETRMGKLRVRVQECSVAVLLHDGYDWQKTRKAIEDEIKEMRRRLEKIKQLLASGQMADASIDNTSSVLFNSVYIGFEGREDMDSTQLMAAIDEELDDLGTVADTDTASSWQTFPDAAAVPHAGGSALPKRSHVRLRGKRLTRSKRAQVEFSLEGLRADIDVYGSDDETASRVHVTARGFEILDHIKTSTWKKFLTEMKADSRGNVRETDADMLRLEITNVRPTLPSTDEEIRVRAKILPLRLHVDQDALDFLKHFFSFTPPGAEVVDDPQPKPEPFFQHVEIFPVELKLDYKPKRVDYSALRAGRTIELMNFFHFEGAEMTLRHVTLSGITGSARLSTMLQDIWTPDVKSNQLADVISGVSPIRSVVNVGSGVADLILLPIEQYRKDGRVARGVQRGTNSFVRSTALEMMKLGARLATGTQVVLERAEGVLGNKLGDSVVLEATSATSPTSPRRGRPDAGSGSSDDEGEVTAQQSRYRNQPNDVREGVQAAYASLQSNMTSAAQTILAVPMEVYERSGDDGPLNTVVRAVPIAVLKPMIGASEAVSKTLWGLRNSLDPESRREIGDKYK